MCVIFGTPSEKWYARPKNGTLVPKTTQHFKRYAVALFMAFYAVFRGKRYAVRLYGTQRTLSKRTTVPFSNGTLYAFWYAVRFSVAIIVPFIAADKVHKSYTKRKMVRSYQKRHSTSNGML